MKRNVMLNLVQHLRNPRAYETLKQVQSDKMGSRLSLQGERDIEINQYLSF